MRTISESSGFPDTWTSLVPPAASWVALGSISTEVTCFSVDLLWEKMARSEIWKPNCTTAVSPSSRNHSLFLPNAGHSKQVASCLNGEWALVGLGWISNLLALYLPQDWWTESLQGSGRESKFAGDVSPPHSRSLRGLCCADTHWLRPRSAITADRVVSYFHPVA